MSGLEEFGRRVGSLRYARDLLEYGASTVPWWEIDYFSALRGCAPDATGDLSSEAFIRQMRDQEWPDPERERVIPRTNSERISK